ncbi:MAG: cupin-like domain-containing protein [Polyangiales bacterium]
MSRWRLSQGDGSGTSLRAAPRRAAPRDLGEAEALLADGPCVTTGLLSDATLAGLSLDALLAAHGDARVPVAPVREGRVVLDPRRGLGTAREGFADFARRLRAGPPDGYLAAAATELPPAFAATLATPAFARAARWCVTKLWVGGAGTVSALHRDLAHNAHTVVEGRKRFWLASPAHDGDLYPSPPWSSVPNGSRVDPEAPDLHRFPRSVRVRPWVVDLGPGETLLLPSRWWHHVRTLAPSVSVNTFCARPMGRGDRRRERAEAAPRAQPMIARWARYTRARQWWHFLPLSLAGVTPGGPVRVAVAAVVACAAVLAFGYLLNAVTDRAMDLDAQKNPLLHERARSFAGPSRCSRGSRWRRR